jgi:hypothetical protein
MNKKIDQEADSNKSFSVVLYVVTLTWLFFGAWFISCNWPKVSNLEPNALGDMLAGFFAPLAFLWLVAGYLQQGRELAQNTKALLLQHTELVESVEQQRELALVANQDMELFRQQIKDQAYKDNVSAQPLFEISAHEGTTGIGLSKIQYIISNSGHIVSEVTVKVFGAELEGSGFFGVFENGGGDRFTIVYVDAPKEVELLVSYLDGLRIQRAMRFKKADEEARNWILIEDWDFNSVEQ